MGSVLGSVYTDMKVTLESQNILSWKGQGSVPGLAQDSLRALSKHFLHSGRLGAINTSLGGLFQCPATLWWQAHSLSSLRLLICLKYEGAAHDYHSGCNKTTLKLFGMKAQASWKKCRFFLFHFNGDKFGFFFPFEARSMILLRRSDLRCNSASYLCASKERKMACEMWEINPCHRICAMRDTCNNQMQ